VNGKSVKMPPATVWQNGFGCWPSSRIPEIVESTCPPVFRLAIKQGQAEKARESLMKFGAMDAISGLNIGDRVRETLSRVEEEAISEPWRRGQARRERPSEARCCSTAQVEAEATVGR